jgi:predicted HicB family RNase H-like nuclease
MKYKGYTGLVELEEGSDVLFGRVIGLRDVITFQGESVKEVTQAFHDSVDDYLAFCAERNEKPEKPYSGQFVLRIDPQLHRELASLAQVKATSLNALIESVLEKDVRTALPLAAKSAPMPPARISKGSQFDRMPDPKEGVFKRKVERGQIATKKGSQEMHVTKGKKK